MFTSIDEIKAANEKLGKHWFDATTMKFFGTRISATIYGGRYFVTSERSPDGPRMYTVRRADNSGNISTIGEFCGFGTLRDAKLAAESAARFERDHHCVPRAFVSKYAATRD